MPTERFPYLRLREGVVNWEAGESHFGIATGSHEQKSSTHPERDSASDNSTSSSHRPPASNHHLSVSFQKPFYFIPPLPTFLSHNHIHSSPHTSQEQTSSPKRCPSSSSASLAPPLRSVQSALFPQPLSIGISLPPLPLQVTTRYVDLQPVGMGQFTITDSPSLPTHGSLPFFLKAHLASYGEISSLTKSYLSPGTKPCAPLSSAKDQLTGSSVAIKKIMKPFSTPVLSKRTYRELKLLKHIKHENVSPSQSHNISLGP